MSTYWHPYRLELNCLSVRDGRLYTEYFSVYEVALDSPCPVFRLYARKQSVVAFISNRVDVALGVDCLVCADCTRIHLMSLSGNRQKTWIHNTDGRDEGSHLQVSDARSNLLCSLDLTLTL